MQYGMTVRHPWLTEGVVCDPRIIWKEWDYFGIEDSKMIGFWEKDVPVKADDESVKITVYKKNNKVLISLGNYSDETKKIRLKIDWKSLGLNPKKIKLSVPEIQDFQNKFNWTINDLIVVGPRKGLIMYLE